MSDEQVKKPSKIKALLSKLNRVACSPITRSAIFVYSIYWLHLDVNWGVRAFCIATLSLLAVDIFYAERKVYELREMSGAQEVRLRVLHDIASKLFTKISRLEREIERMSIEDTKG